MSDRRWISLDTTIFSHSLVGIEPAREYTRMEAWQWLIARAAWAGHNVRNKGKLIYLQRGQLPAARDYLAREWRWGAKRVRNFLDQLAAEGMILKGQSSGHFANIITICNYDRYQLGAVTAEAPKGQSGASVGPEQGQTFTKDNTNTSRESVPSERLYDLCCEAAGDVLCPIAKGTGMIAVSEVHGWLANGADLELDILPAIRITAKRAKDRGSVVRGWAFFGQAVAERRRARLAGLPTVRSPASGAVCATEEIRKMRLIAGAAA